MQISLSIIAQPSESPLAAIVPAAAAGAAGVELRYMAAESRWLLSEPKHGPALAARAAEAGVAVSDLYLGCLSVEPALIGRDEIVSRNQQLVRQGIETAAAAGVQLVTLPFFGRNCIETDAELARAGEALSELVDAAGESGVTLAVESTLNTERQVELLSTLGGPGEVKVHFNTGVALSRKLDAATCIRDLGRDAIGIVRLRDVRLREGSAPDFDVPLGEGDVDFGGVGQALRAIGYQGWVIVEPASAAAASAAVQFVNALLK